MLFVCEWDVGYWCRTSRPQHVIVSMHLYISYSGMFCSCRQMHVVWPLAKYSSTQHAYYNISNNNISLHKNGFAGVNILLCMFHSVVRHPRHYVENVLSLRITYLDNFGLWCLLEWSNGHNCVSNCLKLNSGKCDLQCI